MNYYFVTGSSKGLGKAIAELLLQNENNFVFGFSRSTTINHQRYYHKHIDFANLEMVQKMKFPELKDAEKLVLINNAGVLSKVKHLGNLDSQNIIDAFTINLIVPTILTNEFIKMYQQNSVPKVIANISSGAGRTVIDGWGVYCASKAGIDMLSQVVQEESNINKNNITVLSIAPGIIDTEMQQEIRKVDETNFSNLARFIEYKKNGDLARAEDTAKKIMQFIVDQTLQKSVVCSVRNLTKQ